MTDASKGSDKASAKDAGAPPPERRRGGSVRDRGDRRTSVSGVRSKIASVVWLVAVVCALFLAVGALLIALKANQENALVSFVLDGAQALDGPFSLEGGIFEFDDRDAEVKNALVNWGIAAVAYLVIGKVLDRLIRP